MCDTLVIVRPDRVWFAKNSDRDPNEAQMLDWQPARIHPPASWLKCTYLEIPQVERTAAVLLSRPFWMWGAEMGTNEHGVCIGNEAVFTREPCAASGLTGMDLVRLGLERGSDASSALEIIIHLLETYGQGGGCGLENRHFTYHNSFLIADPCQAFVLETAGRYWASERVTGVRSISNGLTIAGFAEKHRDRLRTHIANCQVRQQRTSELGQHVTDVCCLMSLLRDHGAGSYSWVNGKLNGPCAHGGGLIAATQTTASWIAELKPTSVQHWVTATSTPCQSIFKPVQIPQPVGLGPWPTDQFDASSYWWRHEQLCRRFELSNTLERDLLEKTWSLEPPSSADAFQLAEKWLQQHFTVVPEPAPWYVQKYWKKRNRWAKLPSLD